jgi:hypothetical protein
MSFATHLEEEEEEEEEHSSANVLDRWIGPVFRGQSRVFMLGRSKTFYVLTLSHEVLGCSVRVTPGLSSYHFLSFSIFHGGYHGMVGDSVATGFVLRWMG